MILTSLYNYAISRGLMDDLDYKKSKVDYILSIGKNGAYFGLQPTNVKKLVPRELNHTVAINSKFIFDNATYVLGLGMKKNAKPNEKKKILSDNKLKFNNYKQLISKLALEIQDESLIALEKFLNNIDQYAEDLVPSGNEGWTGSELIAIVYDEDLDPIHLRPEIQKYWRNMRASSLSKDNDVKCLVTGKMGPASIIHGKIKSLPGGMSSGASLVSINSDSFESHGFEQGEVSQVSREGMEGYIDAIEHMMTKLPNNPDGTKNYGYNQGVKISEESILLFWTKEKNPIEDDFVHMLLDNSSIIKNLARSPFTGLEPSDSDDLPFYAVTIGGNSGRAVIRDWFESTVGNIKNNLKNYFDDLRIDAKENHATIYELRDAIFKPEDKHDRKEIKESLFKAALFGKSIPRSVLIAACTRFRLPNKDQDAMYKRQKQISLIKITLKRLPKTLQKDLPVSLDLTRTSKPYLIGRLFAVIEKLQREVMGEVNCSVTDKFLSSASKTPASVMPHLITLSSKHESKSERKYFFKDLKGKIIDLIVVSGGFPRTFTLEESGEFFIGYYSQNQHFYKKQPVIVENNEDDDSIAS